MKIAIVVHGRFHAFDLARALLDRGHEVTLFTNYPKWAARRFGVPRGCIRSFWKHGVFSRLLEGFWNLSGTHLGEEKLHTSFARWAASQVRKEQWDIIHPWSGIAQELLETSPSSSGLRLLMRGSSHIRTQSRILQEESRRVGYRLERPADWMIAREELEYEGSDYIVVLSKFAYESFVSEGVNPGKLLLIPLGADVEFFRPRVEVIQARCERLLSDEPLRILYTGTVCFRKGIWDTAEVIHRLSPEKFQFRFVGPVSREATGVYRHLASRVEFIPKQPQHRLPKMYAWGDLFVFPTLEDGFPQVLAQARASGLPILTTPNGPGSDFVQEGVNGWILPVRDSEAFVERLQWCDAHRGSVAEMVEKTYMSFKPKDWTEVAMDFEVHCRWAQEVLRRKSEGTFK